MSNRATFLCVSLGLLLLAAAASPWQKPADPPADAKPAPVASAAATPPAGNKEAAPAKDAPAPKATGFPNTGESLNYALKWPGGASLGEAHLSASKGDKGWQFDFSLNAAVPGFAVTDHYHSRANADFCSLELEKETTHGQRHTHERTVFDYQQGTATRKTLVEGGGHTDININDCAHDGLDYIFYARRELGQGHGVPQQQDVLFGALYSVRMEFAGVQEVTVAGKRRQADHVILHLHGPASDSELDIFFERDPSRTPLIIKAPLPVGTLSMELER
jgi:Protein of unknown function (DUF3108)